MRRTLFATLILCCLTIVGLPQQRKDSPAESSIRISKDRPSVFLTFERFGKAIAPSDTRMAEKGCNF
jgi:hypothetical protein